MYNPDVEIANVVNAYRNGVTGMPFKVAIIDGPEDYPEDKFLVVTFARETDEPGKPFIDSDYTAVFKLDDLCVGGPGDRAGVLNAKNISAWRPEWAFNKAWPLIEKYYRDVFGGP